METKLPLSLKLILPLITMQALAMMIGIVWLSSWLEKSRFRELEHILDTQTDVMEDAVVLKDGKIQFDRSGELVGELSSDRNYYFAILSPEGGLVEETSGPSGKVRELIRSQLSSLHVDHENIDSARFGDGEWRVLRETVTMNMLQRKSKGPVPAELDQKPIGYLYGAIDAEPVIKGLNFVKRAISIGTLLLLVLMTLGTAVIVSSMTANLRKFVQSLADVKPEKLQWNPPASPNSLEEMQLFSSFQDMMTSIQKAAETQRLFIANASHELKTPIAGMMMSLEVMLSKPRSNDEYEATAKRLLGTVRGLKRLSTALLDFSRFANFTKVDKAQVDLKAVFDSLMERWKPGADQRQISLSWNGSDGIVVTTHQDLLEVALGNYIDNAIKYTDTGGCVEISAVLRKEENQLLIAIKDNGIGMSEKDLQNLGQVFFRANEARSEGESYGLGYAQASQIVQLLGYRLDIVSATNAGTTVTIRIPV